MPPPKKGSCMLSIFASAQGTAVLPEIKSWTWGS